MQILNALIHSLRDLFKPRMLLVLLLPPIVALTLWVSLSFLLWPAYSMMAQEWGTQLLGSREMPMWLTSWFSENNSSLAVFLAGFLGLMLVVPLIFLTSQLIASVFAMPMAVIQIHRSFPDVQMRGRAIIRNSLGNLIITGVVYLALWLLSLPLWMTGLGFAIPLFLNGYLNYRLFAYEALVGIATPIELKKLMKKNRLDFLILGLVTASLVLIPPLFLILPIYTALCFTRYSFMLIQERRRFTDRVTSN